MKIPRTQLAKILVDKSEKSGVSNQFGREIAAYLLSEHRTGEVDSLIRDIQHIWAQDGYVNAMVVAARPIPATTKTELEDLLKKLYPTAKKIIISEQQDPNVIGGVRLELADDQLDLTIRNKLSQLRQLTGQTKG